MDRTRIGCGGDRCCGNSDHAIAIEILVESIFGRFQRSAGPRYDRAHRDEVAAAVGIPDDILVAATELPGYLVSAGYLLRADGSPSAMLPGQNGGTGIFQLGPGSRAVALKK